MQKWLDINWLYTHPWGFTLQYIEKFTRYFQYLGDIFWEVNRARNIFPDFVNRQRIVLLSGPNLKSCLSVCRLSWSKLSHKLNPVCLTLKRRKGLIYHTLYRCSAVFEEPAILLCIVYEKFSDLFSPATWHLCLLQWP